MSFGRRLALVLVFISRDSQNVLRAKRAGKNQLRTAALTKPRSGGEPAASPA